MSKPALKIWSVYISAIDKRIEQEKPWTLKGQQLKTHLQQDIEEIVEIAKMLIPFLPQTAEKILAQFKGPKIKSGAPLFPRIK